MAHITADRVRDTSTTVGTGDVTVSGIAPTGYRTLSVVLAISDTFWYAVQHQTMDEWEVGLGTYSAANQFTRTTVLSSSNAGSAVAFSAGTKDVFITLVAGRTLQQDANGNVGIGGVPSTQKLLVSTNSISPTPVTNTLAQYVGADGQATVFLYDTFASSTQISGRRANGTAAAPTALVNNSVILALDARGYGATGYTANVRGSMEFSASQTWTDAAQGTYIRFLTTTNGTTTITERVRIDNVGSVGIGYSTISVLYKLQVNGVIADNYGPVRSTPQVVKTSAYTLVATDNGQHISITTGGVTVPGGVFNIGDSIMIYNNSASSQTITQGPGVTMYLAGTATTGNRTLAQRGVCTLLYVAQDVFVISGFGLT